MAQAGGRDPAGLPGAGAARRAIEAGVARSVKVLALDHGTARTGCAVSDPSGTFATGPHDRAAGAALGGAARAERGAELVVVGLPLHLSGEEGSQAALSRTFCVELEASSTCRSRPTTSG